MDFKQSMNKNNVNSKCIILSHFNMGDCITTNGLVQYISEKYNEIIIFCNPIYVENVKILYENNPIVNIMSITNEITQYKKYSCKIDNIAQNQLLPNVELYAKNNNYDVLITGIWKKNRNSFDCLPFNFYDDLNIPRKYFWEYSNIPNTKESLELFNQVKNIEYIFIHMYDIESINEIIKKLNINQNEILIINPNLKIYNEKSHIYYNKENNLIKKPIFDYVEIIKNAKKIICTDSSFFCLAMQLQIKSNDCFIYKARNDKNYDYVWNSSNGYNKDSGKKIFNTL